MESDSDNYEDLYEDDDVSKHDKLVGKVLSLNKIHQLRKPSRTEPALQVSEFNLVKSVTGDEGAVHVSELTKVLRNKRSRVKISEDVKKINKKSRTLPKPLEKPQAERIRRGVAYEKARLDLDRWEAVVTSNRVSTNLAFPLDNDVNLEKEEAKNFTNIWRLKSKLEEELEKIEPTVEEIHVDLKTEKFPLTMKEMLTKRKEAAKLRAFQGYKEARARRQNKIKSKKYHRILKREKIKQKLKEFEQLQKTDPELALKKLEEIEKSRAEERFSLRHKSTGKWARNKQIRAKYDKESRQALSKQLTISRDLTQKLKTKESESEEENAEEDQKEFNKTDENNPWINGIKPDKEVLDFIGGYRKYWTEKNKTTDQEEENAEQLKENNKSNVSNKETTEGSSNNNVNSEKKGQVKMKNTEKKKVQDKKKKKIQKVAKESNSTTNWEVNVVGDDTANIDNMFDELENKLEKKMLKNAKTLKRQLQRHPTKSKEKVTEKKKIDLSLPLQVKKPVVYEELHQTSGTTSDDAEKNTELDTLKAILSSETKRKESNIDPNKHLTVKTVKTTNLRTAIPDILTTDENEEEVNQRAIITEAFEDDDIVQDFKREKKDEVNRNKPQNINLGLPGWGSWGGTDKKISRRKRRLFTIKAPKKIPRKDDNKGSLIINEDAQKKVKEHMVSEVPFPFKTVKDFEASMRAPISNTFVPETAYRKLIQPAVTTKMGTIIEPMSKDILLNKNG